VSTTAYRARCARCIAGRCDHESCAAGPGYWAETDVAGTACCGDCALPLLELVLHPVHEATAGGGTSFGEAVVLGRGGGL
jgi:hypothetical protein